MSTNKPEQFKKRTSDYMKYSGMAIQMGVIILVGVYAGKRLDAHFQTQTPWWTVSLSLFSIVTALYIALKDLIRPHS